MTVLVSRNTIKLANNASSTNDFYVGRLVELTRVDSLGKKTVQRKTITNYNGTSKVATIDGLWLPNFHPKAGDSYKILIRDGDGRVSINPAIQTLDYVTSKTYGRGLDPHTDLQLDTWLDAARKCDTRSDIYVRFTGPAPSIGAVYRLDAASNIFQGTVAEVINDYVRFTDIIGKLSYKWFDWRSYEAGALVYHQDRLYQTTALGVRSTAPTHTSGTNGNFTFLSAKSLTKIIGTGPASLPMYVDGNPVRFVKNGVPASGYTLYDSDGVDYHRYLGWAQPNQRFVTRHQTNISIDTSLPLFDNTNSMLQHFGGMMRYSGDKYILEVEEVADDIADSAVEPRNITDDDIIGRISLTDEGIRNSFNSLTASYTDPGNRFEARNISFFNSDYLKADRNVPKKGNVTIPGITNYYNARILADKFLTRSRYGLSVNMNIKPKGVLLLPGKVIQMQYPRYGWVNKKFRIENLTHNEDCSVDIVATEYDDSFYTISNIKKQAGIGLAGEVALTTLAPPSSLVTTSATSGNEQIGAIELRWINNPLARAPTVTTQIYASHTPNLVIEIDSITGAQTLTSVGNHGLTVGQKLTPEIDGYGLVSGATYYVKSVPTGSTFTLTESKAGPIKTNLVNTTTNFNMWTATVIAEVDPPISTYVDKDIYSVTGSRVEKYYWLRYKVIQG